MQRRAPTLPLIRSSSTFPSSKERLKHRGGDIGLPRLRFDPSEPTKPHSHKRRSDLRVRGVGRKLSDAIVAGPASPTRLRRPRAIYSARNAVCIPREVCKGIISPVGSLIGTIGDCRHPAMQRSRLSRRGCRCSHREESAGCQQNGEFVIHRNTFELGVRHRCRDCPFNRIGGELVPLCRDRAL